MNIYFFSYSSGLGVDSFSGSSVVVSWFSLSNLSNISWANCLSSISSLSNSDLSSAGVSSSCVEGLACCCCCSSAVLFAAVGLTVTGFFVVLGRKYFILVTK